MTYMYVVTNSFNEIIKLKDEFEKKLYFDVHL